MIKRKQSIIMGIIILVLFIGLGYSYLSTTLNINGTTDIDSNTWNVFWDNVQVTSGSVTGTQVTQAPTIDTNKTTISFQVRLSKPGDFYEFTVDAKNTGSIDAMVDTISKTTSIPNYIKYDVSYDDGVPIEENQLLKANSTEKIKIRVEYKSDISASEINNEATTLSLQYSTTYVQSTNESFERKYYVYTTGSGSIGEELTEYIVVYNTYQEAINNYGHNLFFKILIENDVVEEVYLGFIKDGKLYYIQGEAADYTGIGSNIFNNNVQTLREVFGENNCIQGTTDYRCSSNEWSQIFAGTYNTTVYARDHDDGECYLEGTSYYCE